MKRPLVILALLLSVLPAAVYADPLPQPTVTYPIDGFTQRQTVKTYGTYVDQSFLANHPDSFKNNGYPKFTGFHAGVDVDYTAPDEQAHDLPVKAMADGQVIYKGTVTGYGGVIVIRHEAPASVTSLYGHIRLSDVPVNVGDVVKTGQHIANLGTAFSAETGGERRHLHFGIHRGPELNLDGHEPTEQALISQWINPNDWFKQYLSSSPTAPPTAISRPPLTSTPHKSFWAKVVDFLTHLF